MRLTSKPTFVASKIFNEKLVAVHKIKELVILNRPAYVGMLCCIHTKKLSCLKSGVEFDMNDILYEFKNLDHF